METERLLHLPISIMNLALLGKKIGMTQVFDDNNRLVPVTVIEAGPCPVTQIKSSEKDGYNAVQIAAIETGKDISHVNKPQRKLFSSIKIKPKKILKEFRVDNDNILDVGTKLNADHFKVYQFELCPPKQ